MESTYNAKVVVTGDSGVGKSTLTMRFVNDRFYPESSTIGVALIRKRIIKDNNILLIDFWDTAGQEKYVSLCNFYFRNCDYCILVFDIGDLNTFLNIIKWLNMCRNINNEKTVYVLVGNKSDRTRQVSSTTISDFCKENNIYAYFETCSGSGEGVNDLYESLSNNMISHLHTFKMNNRLTIEEPSKKCSC